MAIINCSGRDAVNINQSGSIRMGVADSTTESPITACIQSCAEFTIGSRSNDTTNLTRYFTSHISVCVHVNIFFGSPPCSSMGSRVRCTDARLIVLHPKCFMTRVMMMGNTSGVTVFRTQVGADLISRKVTRPFTDISVHSDISMTV